jgi:hypothetical protein
VPTFSDLRLAIYSLSKDGDPEELCQSDDFRVQEKLMKFFGISFHFHQFFQELSSVSDADISFLRPSNYRFALPKPLETPSAFDEGDQMTIYDHAAHHLSRRNMDDLLRVVTKNLEALDRSEILVQADLSAEGNLDARPVPIVTPSTDCASQMVKTEHATVYETSKLFHQARETFGIDEPLTPRVISGKRDSSVTIRLLNDPPHEARMTYLCSVLTPQPPLPPPKQVEVIEEVQIVRIDPSNYTYGTFSEEFQPTLVPDPTLRPLLSLGATPSPNQFDSRLQQSSLNNPNQPQPITNPYLHTRERSELRKPDTRSLFVQRYERMLLGSAYAREDIFTRNIPKENLCGLPNRHI